MNDAILRLRTLKVGDVMSHDVVQVRADQSMVDVARIFRERDISAAPVVDDERRCVGKLSSTDYLRRDSGAEADDPAEAALSDTDRAADYMTTAVQTIRDDELLLQAARVMCMQHVHRLIVLDGHEHVTGVVSTMDVVAALLNAIEEMEVRGR